MGLDLHRHGAHDGTGGLSLSGGDAMVMLLLLQGCVSSGVDAAEGIGVCQRHVWYADTDGDGWGGVAIEACDAPAGAVSAPGDCDDARADRYPKAVEDCDDLDQDCDGVADDGLPLFLAAPDADGDGFGDASRIIEVCALPPGWASDAVTDCDDSAPSVNPGAPERCNEYDDDCDGLVDDDDADLSVGGLLWFADTDGDGYGAEGGATAWGCVATAGFVASDDDCDDLNPAVNPGAAEVCFDFLDQDCDGYSDDYEGCPSVAIDSTCDPTITPMEVTLCVSGVAAALPSGETFTTVQAAIDAAMAGDVVTVCPGRWSEELVQGASPLSLVGYGVGISVLAGSSASVITMGTGADLTLVDLSVEAGAGTYGGGVAGEDATLCVSRTAFSDNDAEGGGAIYLAGTGRLSVESAQFMSNGAELDGGAILVDGAYAVTILDSTFEENTAGRGGGAAWIDTASPTWMSGTTFLGNRAEDGGAVVFQGRGSTEALSLSGVVFSNNTASGEGGALSIGAFDAPTVDCFGCAFEANTAGGEGGAVMLQAFYSGRFRAEGSTFSANAAGAGGALCLHGWGDETGLLLGSAVTGNEAMTGGAFNVMGGLTGGKVELTVVDSTVTSNTTSRDCGGAANVGAATDSTLISSRSDWGTAAHDNLPDDVCPGFSFGAAASFTCSAGKCR